MLTRFIERIVTRTVEAMTRDTRARFDATAAMHERLIDQWQNELEVLDAALEAERKLRGDRDIELSRALGETIVLREELARLNAYVEWTISHLQVVTNERAALLSQALGGIVWPTPTFTATPTPPDLGKTVLPRLGDILAAARDQRDRETRTEPQNIAADDQRSVFDDVGDAVAETEGIAYTPEGGVAYTPVGTKE